jgi:hypothetical protein
LVALVAFGGMWTVWIDGFVLWCVGGTGGHGKNDGISISITNAGAKCPTFYAILIWSV